MNAQVHPAALHHLPVPGAEGSNVLIVVVSGLVHALLLRIQALLLPIKTRVLSGH